MNKNYITPMMKEDSLKDKVIVITGGGTGLGKAMGGYFLELGANIVIASRKFEVLEKTALELQEKTKGKILPIKCDITDYKEVEQLLNNSIEKFGKVDVLVKNAAGNFIGFNLATGWQPGSSPKIYWYWCF